MNAGIIAVIDDNKVWVETVSDLLTSEGYEVRSATNGEQALDLLDEVRPSLIILDIHIPGRNGLQILSDYRARDRSTPILMVSADDRALVRHRAMSYGASGFLQKPIPSESLLHAVRRLTENHSKTDSGRCYTPSLPN